MNILKKGEDSFLLTLTPAEAQIFINSMSETLRRIAASEYWTRMGAEPHEIKATIESLEAALK